MSIDHRAQRYEEMQAVAAAIREELRMLSPRQPHTIPQSNWPLEPLQERLANQPLRAYYVHQIGQYVVAGLPAWRRPMWRRGQGAHLLCCQLPLLFEGIITVQYLHNQILDEKSGVTGRERINANLLQANLLKDSLYRYIDTQIPAAWRPRVTEAVRQTFELVDVGQRLESTSNTYQAYLGHVALPQPVYATHQLKDLEAAAVFVKKVKDDLPLVLHEATDIYFQRIYLTCAALFVQATQLVADLTGYTGTRALRLRHFAVNYGLMRQLVNDNADWLPARLNLTATSKHPTDACSDLRHGVLTLPLLHYLANGQTGPINHWLQGIPAAAAGFSGQQQDVFFEDIIQSQALFQSIQQARILGELAVSYLDHRQPAAAKLAATCDIVHWNKFLVPCLRHPAYAVYRKTSGHQRTKQLIQAIRQQRECHTQQTAPAKTNWLAWLNPRRLTTPTFDTYASQLLQAYLGKSR